MEGRVWVVVWRGGCGWLYGGEGVGGCMEGVGDCREGEGVTCFSLHVDSTS